ncbi:MAG TPA: chromate transporter, partial [Candidatus Dormibacteraeota bacterium]|nr:chromate transporter [Candidatus Dormibacteraeota bacterium]
LDGVTIAALGLMTGVTIDLGLMTGVTIDLGLMTGVTIDLGRAAIVDPLAAALAATSLAVLLRWRPNPLWLVIAGAALGCAHTYL